MPMIHMRPATLADITVLERWDKMPHVINATYDNPADAEKDEWNWAEELAPRSDGTEFFIAEQSDRPIGMMQNIDPAAERTHYWGAIGPGFRALDIWIGEVDCLGQGYGEQMMRFMINRCFQDQGADAILIDPLRSNTRAHRFYERLGFVFVERRQFDSSSDCHVMRLDRNDWIDRI